MRKIFLGIFLIFNLGLATFGCSMIIKPKSLSGKTLETHYFFIGEVIGYTEKIRGKGFAGEAEGMKVKPLTEIHLPDRSGDYFELYTFGFTDGCVPTTSGHVYPFGTKLYIFAKESQFLTGRGAGNAIRLEITGTDHLSIVSKEFATNADSIYDYSGWDKLLRKHLSDPSYIYEWEYLRKPVFGFIYFEAAKDLVRLTKTESETEKHVILKRLLYCPYVDYSEIVEANLSELQNIQTLKSERTKIEESRYFKIR